MFFFSSLSTEFLDRIVCSGYVSLMNLATRRTSHSQSCLNHIYINSELSCVSGVIKTLISDQDAIWFSVSQKKPVKKTLKCIKNRNYSNNSLNAFKSKVAEVLNLFYLYDEFSIDDKMKIFFIQHSKTILSVGIQYQWIEHCRKQILPGPHICTICLTLWGIEPCPPGRNLPLEAVTLSTTPRQRGC